MMNRNYLMTLILLICSLVSCTNYETKLNFAVHTAQYLNPNIDGKTSPLLISIYQLNAKPVLEGQLYQQPITTIENTLQKVLVDKSTFIIKPNQKKHLTWVLHPDTKYIFVVGDYQQRSNLAWYQLLAVNTKRSLIQFKLDAETHHIKVMKLKRTIMDMIKE